MNLKKWETVLGQKRKRFNSAKNRDEFKPIDSKEFLSWFDTMAQRYSKTSTSRLLDKFSNTLNHIQSFAGAISSISQTNEASTVIWGGLRIIITCATRHSSHLEEIFEILIDLNENIPLFEHSKILYGDDPELHWPLRDMFSDFAEYCLKTSAYLSRPPILNYFRTFVTSTPQNDLKDLKKSIEKNHKRFLLAIDKAHREATRRDPRTALATQLSVPIRTSPQPALLVHTGRPRRNYKFMGRADVLKEISSALQLPPEGPDHATVYGPACCVIHGIGGIGKTQTALEYTHQHESKYDAIFWLTSETETELSASYAAIAVKLRLRHLYTPSISRQESTSTENDAMNIEAARDWLETTDKKWLLVFDNIESIESIQRYIPNSATKCGAVIITTQLFNFEPITDKFQKIGLPSLESEESTKLLFKHLERPPKDDEEASKAFEIVKIVGGLPLAISTIGGSILMSNLSIAEFLAHIQRSDRLWDSTESTKVQGYPRSLSSVFELALNKLPDKSRKLINLLGFLNPDNIPEAMLLARRDDPNLEFLGSADELTAMIRDLNLRQLVKRDPEGLGGPHLSLHRSLQLSILHGLSQSPELRRQIFQQALSLIREQLLPPSAIQAFRADLVERYKIYVPQLISLHTHSLWPEPRIELSREFAEIMIDIGTYMWRMGQFKDCNEMLTTAESILEESGLPQSHKLYSDIDDIMGVINDRSGALSREEALRRRLRAVNIRERLYAEIPPNQVALEDKIRLYNAHANLACTYIHDENFEEANRIMEECLEQYLTWGTEDDLPFEYSKYYHHSSIGLMAEGRVEEALTRVKRSVELQRRDAGELGTMYIAYQCRHGILLYHAGEVDDALKVLEECIRGYKATLGDTNAQTMDTYCFVAGILLQRKDYDKAKPYLEHCLKPAHRAGWSEVGIAMAEFRMAKLLTHEAEVHSEAARVAREKQVAADSEAAREASENDVITHSEAADEAKKKATTYSKTASATRKEYIRQFPQHFKGIEHDHQAVHDQMLAFWHGRMTGKIKVTRD